MLEYTYKERFCPTIRYSVSEDGKWLLVNGKNWGDRWQDFFWMAELNPDCSYVSVSGLKYKIAAICLGAVSFLFLLLTLLVWGGRTFFISTGIVQQLSFYSEYCTGVCDFRNGDVFSLEKEPWNIFVFFKLSAKPIVINTSSIRNQVAGRTICSGAAQKNRRAVFIFQTRFKPPGTGGTASQSL